MRERAWYFNADVYCEAHAPNKAQSGFGDETDTPQHCSVCHCPLDVALTSDGVKYVIEEVRAEIQKGKKEYLAIFKVYNGTYFEGFPHYEIVKGWVEDHYIDDRFCLRAIQWMDYQACLNCLNLYWDCLSEDDPTASAECKFNLEMGNKNCPKWKGEKNEM